MNRLIFLSFIGIILWNCNTSRSAFATKEDVQYEALESVEERSDKPKFKRAACSDPLAYAPDLANMEQFPMRYIRLNFHIMNSKDGSQNFKEKRAKEVVKDLLYHFNKKISKNDKMKLTLGNDTPVLPFNYKFEIAVANPNDPNDDGIYFHYDDDLYYFIKNVTHWKPWKKFFKGIIAYSWPRLS